MKCCQNRTGSRAQLQPLTRQRQSQGRLLSGAGGFGVGLLLLLAAAGGAFGCAMRCCWTSSGISITHRGEPTERGASTPSLFTSAATESLTMSSGGCADLSSSTLPADIAGPSLHDLGTGREQVRALIGALDALDALDGVGQACLGDLAADALFSGPGPERGSHAVGGAVDGEFSHQLRERPRWSAPDRWPGTGTPTRRRR